MKKQVYNTELIDVNKLLNNDLNLLNIYDIIYDNSNNIHKQLFKDAIENYCQKNNININEYKIIDSPNLDNIFEPSTAVFIKNGKFDYIDLTNYWNNNYKDNGILLENKFKELLINDDNKKEIEIEYIDYVNGKVQFKNKFTNKKFYIDFKKL